MLDISKTSSFPRSCILLTSLTLFIFCGDALPASFSSPHTSYAAGIMDLRHHLVIQDADVNIEGHPTLSAATIDKIFMQLGSPMAGTGTLVEHAALTTRIDDAFALAVWWIEKNDGEAGVGKTDRNPGSIRGNIGFPVAYDGYTVYPSYAVAITDWFHLLRNNYLNHGLTTVYEICHPYVATLSAEAWAAKVIGQIVRYHIEAPPVSALDVQDVPSQRSVITTGPRPLLAMGPQARDHALQPDRPVLSLQSGIRHGGAQFTHQQRGTNGDSEARPFVTSYWSIITHTQVAPLSLTTILSTSFIILTFTIQRRRKTSPFHKTRASTCVPPTPTLISMQTINPIPLTPFIADLKYDQAMPAYATRSRNRRDTVVRADVPS